jgi:multiple sugar transport system substrate-binding protein
MSMFLKEGGQPPVTDPIMNAHAGDRLDMLMMAEHTAKYGKVMNGGTEGGAFAIYANMAENFTAYWAGDMDVDTAIVNVTKFLEAEFAK